LGLDAKTMEPAAKKFFFSPWHMLTWLYNRFDGEPNRSAWIEGKSFKNKPPFVGGKRTKLALKGGLIRTAKATEAFSDQFTRFRRPANSPGSYRSNDEAVKPRRWQLGGLFTTGGRKEIGADAFFFQGQFTQFF